MKTAITKKGRQITLRPPQAEDNQALLNFVNQLLSEDIFITNFGRKPYSLEEESSWLKTVLRKIEQGKEIMFEAWSENQLAGQIEIIRGEQRKNLVANLHLALAKEFRGEGLGEILIKEAQGAAKKLGIKILTLTVLEGNEAAIALYKKLGFKEFGRLPKGVVYQKELIDEIYMFKRL